MRAVYLCCTFPEVAFGGRYPLSLPCGARTFLMTGLSAWPRDCLSYSRQLFYRNRPGMSMGSSSFRTEEGLVTRRSFRRRTGSNPLRFCPTACRNGDIYYSADTGKLQRRIGVFTLPCTMPADYDKIKKKQSKLEEPK